MLHMKLVFLVLYTVFQFSYELSALPRIINGNDTTIEKHPWMVSIQFLGKHFCGGSIISNDTVITAAHCITELLVRSYRVVAGVTNLNESSTKHNIKSFVIHSRYDLEIPRDYDIAVLKLASELEFSDKVKPIALPSEDEEVQEGTRVIAAGWGITKTRSNVVSNVLREADLTIVNNEACHKKVKEPVTKRMICATGGKTGKDTCKFDSGGPLEHEGTLVGIVSWGRGCGIKNMPGVYTNVAKLRNWIEQHAGT